MKWIFDRRLPKASFCRIEIWDSSLWTSFRLANAMQVHFGRIVVRFRMPWLKRPAMALHSIPDEQG